MNPILRKLVGHADLDAEDLSVLADLCENPRIVEARVDLVREGQRPGTVHVILEGFACRYKLTAEGGRQILAYLIPGDFCDLHGFVLENMDHTVATLSPCKVVEIQRDSIVALVARPKIAMALWCSALVDAAILREWLVNIGQRPAEARLAHVLCELLLRLRIVKLEDRGAYTLPLSQRDLADTIGTSAVHLNRVLQSLRRQNLITWKDDQLVITNMARLAEVSGFNSHYLRIGKAHQNSERAL